MSERARLQSILDHCAAERIRLVAAVNTVWPDPHSAESAEMEANERLWHETTARLKQLENGNGKAL